MTRTAFAFLACLSLAACGDDSPTISAEAESVSLFNQTLDGWVPQDLGLEPGSTFGVTATQFGAQFDIEAAAPGGEGVLVREYVLTPGVAYVASIDMTVESSDGTIESPPWTIVVGTSIEGGDFAMIDAFSTQTSSGAAAQVLPLFGDIAVTAGPASGANDTESEVRLAIGFRPETADTRTYRIREVRVRFIRASEL